MKKIKIIYWILIFLSTSAFSQTFEEIDSIMTGGYAGWYYYRLEYDTTWRFMYMDTVYVYNVQIDSSISNDSTFHVKFTWHYVKDKEWFTENGPINRQTIHPIYPLYCFIGNNFDDCLYEDIEQMQNYSCYDYSLYEHFIFDINTDSAYHFDECWATSMNAPIHYEIFRGKKFTGEVPDSIIHLSGNNITLNKNLISIFPNPSNGKVYIKMKHILKSPVSLTVTDLSGKTVYRTRFTGKEYEFDISSYKKGIYFITIQNNQIHLRHKLIKL